MKLNPKNSFILGYVFMMCIFWAGLQVSHIKLQQINLYWGIGINFIPLFGGLFGIYTAKHWGGFKSAVGKALIFLCLGLLSWSAGNWIWSYYNFVNKVDVPYPSIADVGYILAIPLWVVGIFFLSKATGIKFTIQRLTGRIYVIFLPALAFLFSYYMLYVVARASALNFQQDPLKIFFDLAYPVGDWIILTAAFLVWGLSLRLLGGRLKWPIFITLFGFVGMFFSDFSFSYVTTLGNYYNGHPIDIIFVISLGILSFGVSSIDVKDS